MMNETKESSLIAHIEIWVNYWGCLADGVNLPVSADIQEENRAGVPDSGYR